MTLVAFINLIYFCSVLYFDKLPSIKLNVSLFNRQGIKYMLYAVTGLLVFAIADKFIQLKTNIGSKR